MVKDARPRFILPMDEGTEDDAMTFQWEPIYQGFRRQLDKSGRETALEWARTMVETYRAAMSDPMHFASRPENEPRFKASIRILRDAARIHCRAEID
jgi:hypothetical protein